MTSYNEKTVTTGAAKANHSPPVAPRATNHSTSRALIADLTSPASLLLLTLSILQTLHILIVADLIEGTVLLHELIGWGFIAIAIIGVCILDLRNSFRFLRRTTRNIVPTVFPLGWCIAVQGLAVLAELKIIEIDAFILALAGLEFGGAVGFGAMMFAIGARFCKAAGGDEAVMEFIDVEKEPLMREPSGTEEKMPELEEGEDQL